MKILPRRSTSDASAQQLDSTPEVSATSGAAAKGRPTPKRRDSAPRRAPVVAPPQNRREAMSWQKNQAKAAKATSATRSGSAAPARGSVAYRDAYRRGDESVLPKRDRGATRRLARDWVDSHRMISNYMLILFPLMLLGFRIQYVNVVVLALFMVIVGEWFLTGRKVLLLAKSRGIETRESPLSIGFYAGSRSYLPRRWRLPAPQVNRGDTI
ncbi:hypothetical protein SAMN05892883_3585 [Jatrophihabitans sp. GAS493]|uniref:DUF3043 domain-containing protein n=1 Tax=Jatrophihabitans sp. GAS493 TaxID=1907575 RepID=UPI000BC0E28F|nr:DUF3043 domain-containing protein [Jatrophihabitans sp. GAS493]SOD74401.1 hypothetical protein SAMN05892883_3585 [Jatrophihabitans sp. GAS493]